MAPLKSPGVDGFLVAFFQRNWDTVGSVVYSFVRHFFDIGSMEGLANRTLLVLLPKISNPENIKQFLPISLCMEVIHSMCRKKGATKWMVIKVDLEKAYDRLEWNFIEDTLLDLGLPRVFVSWIMVCVRSVSMQVIWNGNVTDCFAPSHGIRQGGPLSPYLFVISMERLSHAINMRVDSSLWKGIQLSHSDPSLSHLFFADDLVLFAKASFSHLGVISAFGFEVVDDLGRYLGALLLHKGVTIGRITLAESVLQAISTFFMQTSYLSKDVCDKMKVKWETMKLPTSEGGLGFRDLEHQNHALLMKLGFALIINTDALWGLSHIWNDIRWSVCWHICDGWFTDFWHDIWLDGCGPLSHHHILNLPPRPTQVATFLVDISKVLSDSSLVAGIHEMLSKLWDVRVTHVLREVNFVADGLARMAKQKALGEWVYGSPPWEVRSLLSVDISGF
ncbi:hypothetical protein GQ457_05G028150 [Hibiscus cannabinus]